MILFVGDKPSKFNKFKGIPFVGTKSYATLLQWIAKMDVDIRQIDLANIVDLNEVPEDYVRVVALGRKASKHLRQLGVENFFELPHPSGLNRKLNDENYVNSELAKCQKWLGV